MPTATPLADLADGLGTGYELVIGNSLGGLVAVYAAVHDSGFTQRLILLDPALELGDDEFASRSARTSSTRHPTRQSEEQVRANNPGWAPRDRPHEGAGEPTRRGPRR